MRGMTKWAAILAAQGLTLGLAMGSAGAVEGPAPGAVSAQTLKLPDGPGSVKGLAEDPKVSVFSGQMSYQVPLELPQARRGFSPSLALAYRGDLGNGPLGVGWSLGGVAIRRSTRLGVPRFDATDELVLSGVGESGRLVAVGDGTYRLEGRGNDVKIVAEGAGYRVFDQDGIQYRLGQSAGARQANGTRVAAWMVEEVLDPVGQHIVFSYATDQGQIYLTQIAWGPGDTFHAIFELGDRPDVVTSYRDGFAVTSARRVAAVRVEAFGEVLRRYELGYDQSLPLSRLASVRVHGRGGADAITLPPLTFGYAPTQAPTVTPLAGTDGWQLNARGTSLVDVDGDGVDDLLRLEPGNHQYRRNLGGSFAAPADLTGAAAISLDSARLVDVEGKARPDLVTVVGDTWRPYRLVGSGWTALGSWTGTAGIPLFASDQTMADVNGDGRIDVIQAVGAGLRVRFGNALGVDAPVTRPAIGGEILPGPDVLWADLNGDGLADAVKLGPSWIGVYFGQGDGTFLPRQQVAYPGSTGGVAHDRLRLGDLNRDGLMDLAVVSPTQVAWYPGLPGAAMFAATPVALPGPEDAGDDVVIVLSDANGNGSQDVVWSSPRGSWLLDLAGSTSAGMLTHVDNGMGKQLDVSYESSATLARRAAQAGQPWARTLQVAIPVVVRSELHMTGEPTRVTDYDVRDGYWDSAEFTFAGFLLGRSTAEGDTPARSLVTETAYNSGTGASRVLRGRPTTVTRRDGTGKVFDVSTYRWRAAVVTGAGASVLARKPALVEEWVDAYEGASSYVRTQTLFDLDDQGRTIRETQNGRVDLGGDERVIERSFASNEVAWVRDRQTEEKLEKLDGTIVRDTRMYYGNAGGSAPLGEASLGWPTLTEGWLVDASGGRWVALEQRSYDAYGNPLAVSQGGVTRQLAYDADGLYPVRETITPAAGQPLTWTAEWDRVLGQIARVTDAAGTTTRVDRDALGRVVSIAHGAGAPPDSYFVYDWERAQPRTISYAFDGVATALPASLPAWSPSSGWRQSIAIVNGNQESLAQATRLASGRWIVNGVTTRDARGLATFRAQPFYADATDPPVSAPTGTPGTAIQYDALGRELIQTLPNGAVKQITLGALTSRTEQTDLAPVTSYSDGLGHIVRTERTVNGVLERGDTTYDPADRVTSFVQGGTVTSTFSYDLLGRLVAANDPDVGARTLRWDDAGNMIEHQNGTGQKVAWSYDGAGRVTEERLGGVSTFRYHYDLPRSGQPSAFQAGRLAWVEEPTGIIDVGYDALGRQTHTHRSINGRAYDEVRGFSVSGLPVSVSFDDGVAWTASYDPAGRLQALPGLWQATSLDAQNHVLAESFGNGVAQLTERDVMGLPAHVKVAKDQTVFYDVTATRTSFGALTGVVDGDGVGLSHAASYGYDRGGRLVSASLGAAAPYQFGYAYDGLQNMVARSASGPTPTGVLAGTYRYGEQGAGPRQLTSIVNGASVKTFAYDAAGRQVSAAGVSYAYNGLDQLLSVTAANAVTRHAYGFDGQRVTSTEPDGSVWTWFSPTVVERDGARDHYVTVDDRVVARLRAPLSGAATATAASSSPAVTLDPRELAALFAALALVAMAASLLVRERRRFAAAGATVLVLGAQLGAGCASYPVATARDTQALTSSSTLYFHLGLAAGPVLFTSASGTISEERRYEPFGQGLDAYRPGTPSGAVDYKLEPTNVLNKPTDPATGLSFHGARWMAPDAARWLTPDPPVKAPDPRFALEPWELHPYQYVRQNPVVFWDRDGRDKVPSHTGNVDPKSEELAKYYVNNNIDHIESNADQNGARDTLIVHYTDGRKASISIADVALNYSTSSLRANQQQLDKDVDAALRQYGGGGPNVRVLGNLHVKPAQYPKTVYRWVGDVIMPFNENTGAKQLNQQHASNIAEAATYAKEYEQVTGDLVALAQLVSVFSGAVARGGKAVPSTWNNSLSFRVGAMNKGFTLGLQAAHDAFWKVVDP